MRAHTQQNPPGCHEGVWSNGPIGLPPYEVLRLGSPANTGGLRGARAGPPSLRVTNGKGKGTRLEPFQIKHSVLLQLLEDIGRPAEGNSSCFSPARGESMLFRLPVAS